ncbi:hypothetical protein WT60_09740 [Burkholderia sp. MSMB617WGS]|nr:hypothetical protein WT60_09740 [Burkholderia sp. MSMB617WGS]KVK82589.1 hypothetical protein WS91_08510 [Burkholderia sp. MSMB1498]KWZ46119.1 hypothetical protein WS73_18760 [Burkholderia savannae]
MAACADRGAARGVIAPFALRSTCGSKRHDAAVHVMHPSPTCCAAGHVAARRIRSAAGACKVGLGRIAERPAQLQDRGSKIASKPPELAQPGASMTSAAPRSRETFELERASGALAAAVGAKPRPVRATP